MRKLLLSLLLVFNLAIGKVLPGLDVFFLEEPYQKWVEGKRIAILTNHTAVDVEMRPIVDLFEKYNVVALFSPEHGLKGQHYAWESVKHTHHSGIPVYSLHGETRRPKEEMLQGIDVLIYDIQCTGVRAYTYPTSLFYMMEAAAKHGISVIVFDRPNPINGVTVDGPMLEEKWRSYIGYINVPYCHGMTIGELAQFFNQEYKVGCDLKVVPMRGWKRAMSYRDTGLAWIPPSPNVPEPDTPIYCPMTGILGELKLLNIGIGFTMPFKVVGAPWIQAQEFAEKLNSQNLPGVHFHPYHFRPFWGLYKGLDCQGILIQITDKKIYRPLAVQYLLLGMLKSVYPKEFLKAFENCPGKDLFCKANGTEDVYNILLNEKYPTWKLLELHRKERAAFLEIRKKYLIYESAPQ